jgi:hypothetical protein
MSKKTPKKTVSRKTPTKRIKKPKEPKVGKYIGNEYESFCELSCLFFAEELMKAGYVEKVERSPSYLLCDPVQSTYAEQLKKGSKQVTQTVALGVTYTPDYDIYFNEKALGVFCWELGSSVKWDKNLLVTQKVGELYRACCEVKPDFQRASTTPKSVQSMKWLMQKRGVFVNLFRPNRMFEGLFVPDRYRITERGTPRVLKFKALNLQQYLKSKQ